MCGVRPAMESSEPRLDMEDVLDNEWVASENMARRSEWTLGCKGRRRGLQRVGYLIL